MKPASTRSAGLPGDWSKPGCGSGAPRPRKRNSAKLAALLAIGGLLLASAVEAGPAEPKPQLRCGWFDNPTPGNAWLNDRDGEWTVAEQGGHLAEGDWPQFAPERWVPANGNYGYGCACLRVVADAQERRIERILDSRVRPLDVCRQDPALEEPGHR